MASIQQSPAHPASGDRIPLAATLTPSHDGLDGSGRSFRPNGAPAYYLGQPAWLWITAMSSRSTRPLT